MMTAARGERTSTADGVGMAVLGAAVGWALVSAAGRQAGPEGVLLAVVAVAAGYACGRMSGALVPVGSATAASLALLGLAVFSPEGVPGVNAQSPVEPGDTGAAAALLAVSAGAACCAASAARRPGTRIVLRVLAVGVVGTAVALGSAAGVAASAAVVLCAVAVSGHRRRAAALAGLALVTVSVAAVSWAVAKGALPDGPAEYARTQLTENRVALWRDAVALAEEEPVRGVGPQRFEHLSGTAQRTTGSDGKPHSALFQQTAEQGLVGAGLLAAAYGWLLYGLWRSPRPTPVVLSAAAALTALAVLALLGNALSFAPVTAGAGLLAGLATARPPSPALPRTACGPPTRVA
ncbi:O-antigen ligase family protein [Streptomyces sp. NPDC020875]|uniref:O-antigen ligase family protein n=1 Tax=Streptomyces sp. NPDC020875 TaxID=3154898 RepID=UPI003401853E